MKVKHVYSLPMALEDMGLARYVTVSAEEFARIVLYVKKYKRCHGNLAVDIDYAGTTVFHTLRWYPYDYNFKYNQL